MLKKSLVAAALAALLAMPAAAHEIWLERDATGPVRVYFGEPALEEANPEEPNAAKLKRPVLFARDRARPIPTSLSGDHLTGAAPATGDVRLFDDGAFDPWDDAGVQTAAIFYARAGRTETTPALDFEIVPVAAGGDRFTVMFAGKPLPNASVNVITPDKWQKTFKADASGAIAVPAKGPGRYLLTASHNETKATEIGGKPVGKLYHATTLSYLAD